MLVDRAGALQLPVAAFTPVNVLLVDVLLVLVALTMALVALDLVLPLSVVLPVLSLLALCSITSYHE